MGRIKKQELNRKIAVFGGRLVNKSAEGTMGYDLLFRETSEQLTSLCEDNRYTNGYSTDISLINRQSGVVYQSVINNELYIGRQCAQYTGSFLQINESDISKIHCRVYGYAGNLYIEDLNSSNHTYLNGRRIVKPELLRNNDVVNLGKTAYQIKI